MQESSRPLKFNGTAGGYFVASLVSIIMAYVIIIGWPISFNFMANWVVENLEVNGKKLKYSAGYGETLVFLLVNILLIVITFGIYAFWFAPKSYRYIVDHASFVDDSLVKESAPVSPAPTEAPANSTPINI